MNRLTFRTSLPFLAGMLACLLIASHSGIAQDATSLFAGRVIDEAGEPMGGVTVALMPVEDGPGAWFTVPLHEDSPGLDDPRAFAAVTDADGKFSITDFSPGPVLFGLLPFYQPPADVLHVDLNGFIFYASRFARDSGIVFVPEPGEQIENVKVTVRRALQIQGQVRGMDEKPLVNANISLHVQLLSLDDGGKSSVGMSVQTGAEGEFVQWVSRWPTNAPVYYIVSATYQGHRAQAKPFLLRPGTLSFAPVLRFTVPLPQVPDAASRHHSASASVSSVLDPHGVWLINPGNGHAYKKSQYRGPADAIVQASEEGAYLVSINDAAEQQWLERVFAPHLMLIGLNDIAKEGEWRWHSGEPVTYTNWAPHEPHDTDGGEEDYVIWQGGWVDTGPEQVYWRFLRTALIEKEGER